MNIKLEQTGIFTCGIEQVPFKTLYVGTMALAKHGVTMLPNMGEPESNLYIPFKDLQVVINALQAKLDAYNLSSTISAFFLPDIIAELQEQYHNWVQGNAAELIAMMENTTSLNLMCDTETEEGEAVELQYQVRHDGWQYIAYIDRDGVNLRSAEEDADGEVGFLWGDLKDEPDLLGQVIADPEVRKLLD